MGSVYILKMKPYIQPFERALALDELTKVARAVPAPIGEDSASAIDFRVESNVDVRVLAARLAYWETVLDRCAHPTTQSLRESTVNVVRNGLSLDEIGRIIPFGQFIPFPNRRCLRYGPHGVHDYRGKFFPQLVRSLLNIADVPKKGTVVDPMCGSGTTPVEVSLAGYHALAMDMNPLSVEISRTKCASVTHSAESLTQVYESTKKRLLTDRPIPRNKPLAHLLSLPEHDQQYIRSWFSDQVLRDLDQIAQTIAQVQDKVARNLLNMSLSNILRRVSWQKVDDLRIRKEVRQDIEIDPIREFLEEIGRSVRFILAFLRQENRGDEFGPVSIIEGDARTADKTWSDWIGKVDAVITSPPYATALPYLDTDRLSLCYLGLLTRPEHRRRDDQMIGNREVTDRGRLAYWTLYQKDRHLLPSSVHEVITTIGDLNATTKVGFRRRNLPALLSKYFLDMRLVLAAIARLLRPGAPAYVVVGNNHTIAGGQRVEIETARLLGDMAEMVGLRAGAHRPMDMLISRDIFKRNAVESEVILELFRHK